MKVQEQLKRSVYVFIYRRIRVYYWATINSISFCVYVLYISGCLHAKLQVTEKNELLQAKERELAETKQQLRLKVMMQA